MATMTQTQVPKDLKKKLLTDSMRMIQTELSNIERHLDHGTKYYFIDLQVGLYKVEQSVWLDDEYDVNRASVGNVYRSPEGCQMAILRRVCAETRPNLDDVDNYEVWGIDDDGDVDEGYVDTFQRAAGLYGATKEEAERRSDMYVKAFDSLKD